jgi:hypothetical protein
VVKQIVSTKLRQRVSGLSLVELKFAESLEIIISSYQGLKFVHSNIDKADFFRQCLTLNLASDSETLIIERCKLNFHKDMRSSLEYGLDIVFGWLSEDLILGILNRKGVVVHLSGEDKLREFLPQNSIGTSSDFSISIDGKIRPLEIVFSWNDYWKKSDSWDIRDSKFRNLVRPGEESLCLGVELPSLNGFLFDMKDWQRQFIFRPNPAWGNKGAYRLEGISQQLQPI